MNYLLDHPKDATGRAIRLGQRYGYSQSSNGITNVVVGIAENLTETRVMIRVESRKMSCGGSALQKSQPMFSKPAKVVGVMSVILFPVDHIQNEYVTTPGESVMGIALRQVKDEKRWPEIIKLNEDLYPGMGPHDYYPVGVVIKLPE